MAKKIFITGGHLTPALAVIQQLQKQTDNQIFYLGRKHSLEGDKSLSTEFNVISNLRNLSYLSLTTGRLQRRFTSQTIPSILKIPIGFLQSLYYLLKFRPNVILSFGSYVSVPVVFTGWLVGVPTITHEQTIVPSLSSKLITPFAKIICVSWPEMVAAYPADKVRLTGNPIRQEIFISNSTSDYKKFEDVKKKYKLPVLYITGGSQGAHSINKVVAKHLSELLKKYILIHQCGDSQQYNDYDDLQNKAHALSSNDAQKYFLYKFIDGQNIGWVYAHSDIIIGRSGANTVTEIAALGKPAILIPLPWSGGAEQQKNAQMLEQFGGAVILPQDQLTKESLMDLIDNIVRTPSFRQNALKEKQLINLDAAAKIAQQVQQLLKQDI